MTLYWCPLRRSVRIEGTAEKIAQEDSLRYFHQRPRASQIGALASEQSCKIPSRQHLDVIEKKIKEELGNDKPVPLPNWGGYLIKPKLIEFWQGQTDRLHDRIVFRKHVGVEKVMYIFGEWLKSSVLFLDPFCRKLTMFLCMRQKMVGYMNVKHLKKSVNILILKHL